jgi:hypothetical protein
VSAPACASSADTCVSSLTGSEEPRAVQYTHHSAGSLGPHFAPRSPAARAQSVPLVFLALCANLRSAAAKPVGIFAPQRRCSASRKAGATNAPVKESLAAV